jgi:hypothetical protein
MFLSIKQALTARCGEHIEKCRIRIVCAADGAQDIGRFSPLEEFYCVSLHSNSVFFFCATAYMFYERIHSDFVSV